MLYLATDLLLLAGIAGLWLRRRAVIGVFGNIGLVVFVAGILLVRAAAAFGFGTY